MVKKEVKVSTVLSDEKKDFVLLEEDRIFMGRRDKGLPDFHWEEVESDFTLLGHKSVICLPGAAVKSPDKANGCAKGIQEWIEKEGIASDTRSLSIYFGAINDADHRMNQLLRLGEAKDSLTLQVKKPPQDIPLYCRHFFEAYFAPLIINPVTNKRWSLSEAKQNVRNVALVTLCHGSCMALDIEILMQEKMAKAGYTSSERDEIQKQLLIINTASRARMGKSKSTVIHYISLNDPVGVCNWRAESLYSFLYDKKRCKTFQSGYFSLSENEAVFFADRLFKPEYLESEHMGPVYMNLDAFYDKLEKQAQDLGCLIRRYFKEAQTITGNIPSLKKFLEKTAEEEAYAGYVANGETVIHRYHNYLKQCRLGRTSLHRAIQIGNVQEVNLLTHWQIPVTLMNDQNEMPLVEAIKLKNITIIEKLIENTDNETWYSLMSLPEKGLLEQTLETNEPILIQRVLEEAIKRAPADQKRSLMENIQRYCIAHLEAFPQLTKVIEFAFEEKEALKTLFPLVACYERLKTKGALEQKTASQLAVIIEQKAATGTFGTDRDKEGRSLLEQLRILTDHPGILSAFEKRFTFFRTTAFKQPAKIKKMIKSAIEHQSEGIIDRLLCHLPAICYKQEKKWIKATCAVRGSSEEIAERIFTRLQKNNADVVPSSHKQIMSMRANRG